MVGSFSHWEKVARQAPDEGSPPHHPSIFENRGTGFPHPALAAPPSPGVYGLRQG